MGGRVLLVDDDRAMLEAHAEMVAGCGYEPVAAGTWSDALRLFRTAVPDMVLLDVMMPSVDGYKLARMIKSEASGRFVPVILITALDDMESKRRGMAAGADDFLTKPVTQLELQIRLGSMLRIKELTDEIQRVNSKLAELAITDELTKLINRRALYDHLEREFARSARYGSSFSVFVIDIDRFKDVNDTHGHSVGDQVLITVATTLRTSLRTTDVVGRYGGEEFLILAPETDATNARVLGERLRQAVERATASAPEMPAVTISVGIASSDVIPAGHYEELVQLADEALYEAKRAGRNRCMLATPP